MSLNPPADQPEDHVYPARSRLWMVLLAATFTIVAGAVLALVVFRDDGASLPGTMLDLGAVIAEEDRVLGTVKFRLDPADHGENQIEIVVEPADETSLSGIEAVDIDLVPYVVDSEPRRLSMALSGSPRTGRSSVTLTGASMWEASIRNTVDEQPDPLATFIFMLPDPNLHGSGVIPFAESDSIAERLYQWASEQVSRLHRVTYRQELSDGAGLAVTSLHAVNDGADGSTPGFTYRNTGGFEAVVIGTTAWSRDPDEAWTIDETNQMVPPSEWGGEYTGATGFQVGPVVDTPAGRCRTVTFLVPEAERRSIAWYAWCIDEESGNLLRDAMISRNHYMVTAFDDFNADIRIEPPEDAAGNAT